MGLELNRLNLLKQSFKFSVLTRDVILNSYSMRGWSNISFIQPRQVIFDEAVGRVEYHLGEAE